MMSAPPFSGLGEAYLEPFRALFVVGLPSLRT